MSGIEVRTWSDAGTAAVLASEDTLPLAAACDGTGVCSGCVQGHSAATGGMGPEPRVAPSPAGGAAASARYPAPAGTGLCKSGFRLLPRSALTRPAVFMRLRVSNCRPTRNAGDRAERRPEDLPAIIAMFAADSLGGHGDTTDAAALARLPGGVRGHRRLDFHRSFRRPPRRPGGCHLPDAVTHAIAGAAPATPSSRASRSRRAARAGIGAAMVAHAEAEARARGAATLALTSNAARIDAHRFYERLGFAEDARRLQETPGETMTLLCTSATSAGGDVAGRATCS